MLVHKFIRKPYSVKNHPLTIQWRPQDVAHKPRKHSAYMWCIYNQEKLNIKPGEIKVISLCFGIEMSRGVVFVALVQALKYKKLTIHNEVIVNSMPDVVIAIQNNSEEDVTLLPGNELCYLCYLKT